MEGKRLENGVRARADGQGDAWANEHRTALGSNYFMQDFDAVVGHIAFAHNSAERIFCEYVPDTWRNHEKVIREFAVVAMFDRKASEQAAINSVVSSAFYLWLCRTLGRLQPSTPKFFYVCGAESPWLLIELDVQTGERIGRYSLTSENWLEIWSLCGLGRLRDELSDYLPQERDAKQMMRSQKMRRQIEAAAGIP